MCTLAATLSTHAHAHPDQVADPAQLEGESPVEARRRALGVIGNALEGAKFAACDEPTQITLPLVFD